MKISRRFSYLLSALAALTLFGGLQAARAGFEQQVDTVTGTIAGINDSDGILTVETRTNRLDFILTDSTRFVVNGRAGALNDLAVDDRVAVTYETFTYNARKVEVTRQRKRTGRITSITNNAIGIRQKDGQRLSLQRDGQSRIRLNGSALDDVTVLLHAEAVVTYDPSDRTLLSLNASAPKATGTVSAFDAAASTLTLTGRRALTFNIDENATLRRDDAAAEMADIAVGDTGTIYYLKEGTSRRAIRLDLKSAAKTSAKKN